jgi:N-dimethylarginine dimethylaminohydrolase
VLVSAVQCNPPARGECLDVPGCRYQVAWSINPHMRVGEVDFARALAQHEALKTALRGEGARVVEMPFVHGAFDSVFAKDVALVLERRGRRRALLASQRHPERRVETAARRSFYESLDYDVIAPPAVHWEGGDVAVLPPGDRILFGHGPRSDARAAAWLEQHTGASVLALELRDPFFFHLDVALGVLPDATVLVCEECFTPDSLRALRALPGIREIVAVDREDALRFGLNILAVGDAILCGADVPAVQRIIRARGFRPVLVPLDQFHLAGGSAACLVTHVHGEPHEAVGAMSPYDTTSSPGAEPRSCPPAHVAAPQPTVHSLAVVHVADGPFAPQVAGREGQD